MAKVKEVLKNVGANVWEALKSSFLVMIFYGMLSSICFTGTMYEDWSGPLQEGLNGARIAWVIIIPLLAVGYNAFYAYAMGGKGYEMLVSGNMKRMSAQQLGSSYKISSHKELQEYREWKGFAMGAAIGVFTILFGILMGANSEEINKALTALTVESEENKRVVEVGVAVLLLASLFLSGWSLMPFVFINIAGGSASYYLSCLFGLLPIVVSGVMYIVGAYSKRAKTFKAQEEADRAARAQEEKPRKINYGGLPGTKPNKRRK